MSKKTKKLPPRAALPMYDREAGTDIPWMLGLNTEINHDMIIIEVNGGFTIGRGGLETFSQHHLDLTPYGAQNFGVSRVHARISTHKNGLAIHDLGSTNGTYINGYRIEQFTDVSIQDGDLIELGNFKLEIGYLEKKDVATA